MNEDVKTRLARVIWTASRADEGTISATGANIVADALLASPEFQTFLAEREAAARSEAFIGSQALMTALYETYEQHIGITEIDGPDGGYIWCACGWRSDDLGPNDTPGASYAVHLVNAQHAAAVKALQPLVVRRAALTTGAPDA